MIWTALLWLGMQTSNTTDNGNMIVQSLNLPPQRACIGSIDADALYPYLPLCESATPIEHVFEIKTKRELRAMKDSNGHADPKDFCDEGFTYEPRHHVGGDVWALDQCIRITRELWLDGKKLGTIQGDWQ